jgi:predicted transcriptional regulator
LTAAQRATVLAWIVANSPGNPHPYLQMTDGTLYTQGMTEAQAKSLLESGQHDNVIVDYYDNVMLTNYGTLPNTSVPNPVSAVQAVADFLTKLESGAMWKRIGIGTMGALVIVFAAVLLFRNDIPKVIPV